MNTRFKIKKDAKDFAQELNEKGYKNHIYKGHRYFVVQHNDVMQSIDLDYADSFERK